ncbi:hypothetical protein GCM10027605_22930 [Micromonospora zhanjiangensis]
MADDARTADQLLPLVPPTGASQLVATSRLRLAELAAHHAVHALPLAPLDPRATHDLLERIVGAERLRDPAASRVVNWCGGYPLAIRLVGSKLAARPGQELASFADELVESADDLLVGDLRSVHAALASAHRSLSPAAAHLFGRLGLDPNSARCIHTTVPTADASARRVRRLIDELIAVNLVAEAGPDCYRFHDLVYRFARARGRSSSTRTWSTSGCGTAVRPRWRRSPVADPHPIRSEFRVVDVTIARVRLRGLPGEVASSRTSSTRSATLPGRVRTRRRSSTTGAPSATPDWSPRRPRSPTAWAPDPGWWRCPRATGRPPWSVCSACGPRLARTARSIPASRRPGDGRC